MNDNVSDKDPLVSTILARIEGEDISPHSRTYFLAREYSIWLLWLITVLVGAVAVAVALFTLVYRYFDLHEVIRETFWLYSLDVLPYLWLATIILMLVLAVFNIRHTSHGYRYSLWVLIVSSLMGSLGGGVALYAVGFGFLIDTELGIYVDVYDSQDKVERLLWQEPDDGRLLGDLMENDQDETEFNFIDSNNLLWHLNVTELPEDDFALLKTDETLRLLGSIISNEPPVFLVCGVLPAVARHEFRMSELMNRRRALEERMIAKHKVTPPSIGGLCTKAIFMRRLGVVLPQ